MLVLSFYSCCHINIRIKFVGGNLFDNYYYCLRFFSKDMDSLSSSVIYFSTDNHSEFS